MFGRLAAVLAVVLVPAVVDRDLELVAARGHGEGRGVHRGRRPGPGRSPRTAPASRRRSRARSAASRPASRSGAAAAAAGRRGAQHGDEGAGDGDERRQQPGEDETGSGHGRSSRSEQPVGPGPLSIGWGARRRWPRRTDGRTTTSRSPCELLAKARGRGRCARAEPQVSARFCSRCRDQTVGQRARRTRPSSQTGSADS